MRISNTVYSSKLIPLIAFTCKLTSPYGTLRQFLSIVNKAQDSESGVGRFESRQGPRSLAI